MAEYSVVMKEAKRMCWHYTQGGNHDKCPMYPSCNVSQCRKIAFERPEEFEGRVMKWAEEHPEPVYPTWYAWLANNGVVPIELHPDEAMLVTEIGLLKQIPACIAEKYGIQPKEGV